MWLKRFFKKNVPIKKQTQQNFPSQKYIKQLIKKQKQICFLIKKLYSFMSLDHTKYDLFQIQLTKTIIDEIYNPIKQGLKLSIIKEEQIGIFQFLFTQKIFHQLLHSQYSLLTHSKEEQILENRKGRDLNKIMQSFTQQTKLPLPASINEQVGVSYQYWKINKQPQEQVFSFDIEGLNEESQKNIAAQICRLLNNANKGCCLIAGIQNSMQVKGIKLSYSEIINWKQKVQRIRQKYIYPPPDKNQILETNFIKVQKLTSHKYETQSDIKNQNKYLLNIYAKTQNIGLAYFLQEKIKPNQSNYRIYKEECENFSTSQKIYKQIQKTFKQKNKTKIKNGIKQSRKNYISQQIVSIAITMMNKQKQQNSMKANVYGKIPIKSQAHHCIIIIGEKGQKYFEKFLQKLTKDKIENKHYEIYEKLPTVNKRKVYYFTHNRNSEDVRRIVQDIDNDRRLLVFMKIKPQITMLRQQFFGKAFKTLKKRFEDYFNTKLQVLYRRSPNNYLQLQYYFVFENQIQSIFAFVLLQLQDIRTTFANTGKLQNCIKYENLKKQFPSMYIQP